MKNVCTIDRVVRIALGLGIIAWGYQASNWIGAIGIVPLVTGAIGFCPLYKVIGCCGGKSCDTKTDGEKKSCCS